MRKLRQLYLGYLSLFLLLFSTIGWGQTNENPLDITNDDYYYEIKAGESLRTLGELAIVNKSNSKVVADQIDTHEISNSCFLIFCPEANTIQSLTNKSVTLNPSVSNIQGYFKNGYNDKTIKFSFENSGLPLVNGSAKYFLKNLNRNQYLSSNGYNFVYKPNSSTSDESLLWFNNSPSQLLNIGTSSYLNYKTVYGVIRYWFFIWIEDPVQYTGFFMDNSTSNINFYKRLRFDDSFRGSLISGTSDDYRGIREVALGTKEEYPLFNETGARITYSVIGNDGGAIVEINEVDQKVFVTYNANGTTTMQAYVPVHENRPSYKKTIQIKTTFDSAPICYQEFFTNVTISNSINNQGTISTINNVGNNSYSNNFTYSKSKNINDNKYTNSLITTTNGRLKVRNSVITTEALSSVSGASVTVNLNVAGKRNSGTPNIQLSLKNENNIVYKGPITIQIPTSGSSYIDSNNNLSFKVLEQTFTDVLPNSKLIIEVKDVKEGRDERNQYVWFEDIKIQCSIPSYTIWTGENWTNGEPNINREARLRASYPGHLSAKTLVIESESDNEIVNAIVPTGYIYTVKENINIKGENTLKFSKGSYLVTGKNAQVNKEIEFESKSSYYYWDTKMVASPVSNQEFNNIYGPNRALTSTSDYTIFELDANTPSEYNDVEYETTWIPSSSLLFGLGKSYAIQRYKKNNVTLPRFGTNQTQPIEYVESFKGIPNTNDVTVSVVKPNDRRLITVNNGTSTYTYRYNGIYPIGNPFTAPIDIKKFLDANGDIEYIELYRNNNHYNFTTRSYVDNNKFWIKCTKIGCDEGGYGKIDLGTGFNVVYRGDILVSDASYKIKLNHSSIVSQVGGDIFQNRNNSYSTLQFSLKKGDNTIGESIVIGASSETSDEFDYSYDLNSKSNDEGLKILNENLDRNMIFDIRSYPLDLNSKFKISLKVENAGNYNIKFGELKGQFIENRTLLYDKYINEYIEIEDDLTYNFSSEAGEFKDRFEILFQRNLNLNELNNTNFEIYRKGSDFEVNSEEVISTYEIYNLLGSKIFSSEVVNSKLFTINKIPNGISILKFKLANGVIINKKILK